MTDESEIKKVFDSATSMALAGERLLSVVPHLRAISESFDRAEEVLPDLHPEMEEGRGRILQLAEHVTSAMEVINVKLDLLAEMLGQ